MGEAAGAGEAGAGGLEPDLGRLPFSTGAADLARLSEEIPRDASRRLAALLSLPGPRTVASFLDPLDRILLDVMNLGSHGRLLFSVHPDAAVRDAAREAAEASDRWFNGYRLDRGVYDALRGLELARADPPSRFAVEKMLREMRRAGVELDAPGRKRVEALSNEVDRLSNEFQANIVRHPRTIELDPATDLEGLPRDFLESHPAAADGRVRLTTAYTDVLPVLAYARRPEVRKRTLLEFQNRAYPENVAVLDQLLDRRHALARLLGYPTWASYIIEDKMMGTTAAAREFFRRMAATLDPRAREDYARFLRQKQRDEPGAARLEAWDVGIWSAEGYYDQKVRRDEFGVDSQAIRDFFPYRGVRDGLFRLCARLFGLTIAPARVDGLWHPDAEAYDVHRDGAWVGRFYLDLAPREGKYEHAAQFEVRAGIEGLQQPQAALICNFLDPAHPSESRMRHSEVLVFFHEFGHLLHALLAGHGSRVYNLPSQVEWDFIEAPSQIFEEWATDPESLVGFARHAVTGAPIPRDVVERIRRADGVGRAVRWLTQTGAAAVSLDLYDRDPAGIDTTEGFRAVFDRYSTIPMAEGTHFPCAWGHLTGYSALYYTYAWSIVIARDLLRPFAEKGTILDRATAERYARLVLAPGGSKPAREILRDYLGRDFSFEAFDRWVTGTP